MFNFTIRSAGYNDFQSIYRLRCETTGHNYPDVEMHSVYNNIMSSGDETVIMAIHSNHTAGYIHARFDCDLLMQKSTQICSFAYYEYYRDKGILNYLFGAAEKWSVQMDCNSIGVVLRQEMLRDREFLLKRQYNTNSKEAPLLIKKL